MKPKSLIEQKRGDHLEAAAEELLKALADNYLYVDRSKGLLSVLREAYSAGVCVGIVKSAPSNESASDRTEGPTS